MYTTDWRRGPILTKFGRYKEIADLKYKRSSNRTIVFGPTPAGVYGTLLKKGVQHG